MASMPRVMLAAPASGSGKTLITCGLLQALVNRKLNVQSFKCGPDFIDPMFHTKVIGTPSRNLDTFFTDGEMTRYLFGRQAKKADLSVMEGVMGYYDGVAGVTTRASAYDLADVTETPVILIVNVKGMSLSIVPMIRGFLEYREAESQGEELFPTRSHIAGVILNRISPMMYPEIKARIESELAIHVFGYVPAVSDCVIESRHLGLVTPGEIEDLQRKLQDLAVILEDSLEIDHIIKLAHQAPDISVDMPEYLTNILEQAQSLQVPGQHADEPLCVTSASGQNADRPLRIAVARDEAFCFYYEDNLDLLRQMGAELAEFSPLRDEHLPEEISGVIFGGGYPELYAGCLSGNQTLRTEIYNRLQKGLPYLAECGGFMYLHKEMEDLQKQVWPMVGIIDGTVSYTGKLSRFGYIEVETNRDSVYGPEGLRTKAHEFHYFDSTHNGSDFHARKPERKRNWDCVNTTMHSASGFPHFYYYSNPEMALNFLNVCRQWRD